MGDAYDIIATADEEKGCKTTVNQRRLKWLGNQRTSMITDLPPPSLVQRHTQSQPDPFQSQSLSGHNL